MICQVGLGEIEEAVATTDSLDEANNSYAGTTNNINPTSPELDKFMVRSIILIIIFFKP